MPWVSQINEKHGRVAAPHEQRAEADEKDEAAVALGRNPKRPRPSPWDSFAKLVKEREGAARSAQPQAPTAPTVQAQVEAFLAFGPEDVDPLQWWKLNERKYRFVAPLARKFLAQPGSVADVERLWSRARWLESTHGPSMHTSGAFTQFVSLGENAEGLGMPTTRHGGAEQAVAQEAEHHHGRGSMIIDGEGFAGLADESGERMVM